jgi:hypothetical protein
MPHRVLVTAAGTGTAFGLITRLRANWGEEVEIVTADINPAHLVTASVLSDHHIEVPPCTDPAFIPVLLQLIEAHGIDTYVPLLNAELRQANALSLMLTGCDVWSSPEAALLVGSKKAAADWLAGLGINVPPSLGNDVIEPEGSYFAKPDDGSGSHGARRIAGCEAVKLDRAEYVVQPVCIGPEITVDSFFDAATGRARAIARERIEVKSGVSTKARVYEDATLSEIARRIGEGLRQRGTICFQVMQLEGEYVVTDLNLRPGAGTALTVATGIDLISAAFACRWGEDYDAYLMNELPPQGLFVTRQYAEFVMPWGLRDQYDSF